jgi:hypothetical protein
MRLADSTACRPAAGSNGEHLWRRACHPAVSGGAQPRPGWPTARLVESPAGPQAHGGGDDRRPLCRAAGLSTHVMPSEENSNWCMPSGSLFVTLLVETTVHTCTASLPTYLRQPGQRWRGSDTSRAVTCPITAFGINTGRQLHGCEGSVVFRFATAGGLLRAGLAGFFGRGGAHWRVDGKTVPYWPRPPDVQNLRAHRCAQCRLGGTHAVARGRLTHLQKPVAMQPRFLPRTVTASDPLHSRAFTSARANRALLSVVVQVQRVQPRDPLIGSRTGFAAPLGS